MLRPRQVLYFGGVVVLVLAGFGAGLAARGLWPGTASLADLPVLREAEGLLRAHYLADLPEPAALEHGMVRGMLEVVGDPFTIFLEPAAHELLSDTLAGEYGGIGVVLSRDPQGALRLDPTADGPAAQAGVVEGDILLAIDGVPVEPQATLDEVGAALRGPVATRVRLLLARRDPAGDPVELSIERRSIALPSLTGYLQPDRPEIGVVVVSGMTERTADELREAFADLTARGARALVLDLRHNPGGLLSAGVEVADFFLAQGVIVIEQQRGDPETIQRASGAGTGSQIPLAVVVDQATASSAEIVAAALQANGRAPLIGQTTFGKGSVQLIFELSDGSSLHVTSARWLTPERQVLDGTGLAPDVAVDPAAAGPGDAFIQAAVAWLDEHWGGQP